MAKWPPDLLHLWQTFTLSGELDPQHPPATVLEAYTQVAEIQARHLREVVQDIQPDVTALFAESEDSLLPVNLRQKLAVCARCGAGDLEHFYTAKRTGKVLCRTCYEWQGTRLVHNKGRTDG